MTEENLEEDAVETAEEEQSEAGMDQSDIDSLWGDDADDHSNEKTFKTLEEQIIHMSMMNYERLPMLDVIFERMVLSLTNSLKTHTSATADVTIRDLTYEPYYEATGKLPVPGLLSVVRAKPWDSSMIVGIDARLLYAALQIKFGGRKSKPTLTEGRTFTSIEKTVGTGLCKVILNDLKASFAQLTEVDFEIERTETNPQFATISQSGSPCIRVSLSVSLDGRKGEVDFIIPYATIDPVRKLLSKVFFGEKLGGDAVWRSHLTNQISDSSTNLKAVLHSIKAPLAEILQWEVGSTIDLRIDADHEATVYCIGKPIARGKIGKKTNENMAIRVTTDLTSQEEKHNEPTD